MVDIAVSQLIIINTFSQLMPRVLIPPVAVGMLISLLFLNWLSDVDRDSEDAMDEEKD